MTLSLSIFGPAIMKGGRMAIYLHLTPSSRPRQTVTFLQALTRPMARPLKNALNMPSQVQGHATTP